MYVCICRQITDREIRDTCQKGSNSFSELRERLGVASDCGKCGKLVVDIAEEYSKSASFVSASQ